MTLAILHDEVIEVGYLYHSQDVDYTLDCLTLGRLQNKQSILLAIGLGWHLSLGEHLGAAFVSSMYKDVFAFGILIIVLIFRPTGLFRK